MFTLKRRNVVKQVGTEQARDALLDQGFEDVTPKQEVDEKGGKKKDEGKDK
ncbi:hypothetical protein ACE3MQ_19815 [Paenibacillus lentus]|uniref:hypothetical protein n=1 Tax=Paenibacillus lentus TaxID=1338368 RepID=UPI00366A3411